MTLTRLRPTVALFIYLASYMSSFSETVTFKCTLAFGGSSKDVVYVLNSDGHENDATVIGVFGTHQAKVIPALGAPFFYVIEPNIGLSVSTIFYIKEGETAYAIRSTLGPVPEEYKRKGYVGEYVAVAENGYCPVQR